MDCIYLDYGSATPIDPRVLDFSQRYLEDIVGNPSSLHSLGLKAKKAMEESREKISGFINAEHESTIIFTGSATESNNLAIQGCSLRNTDKGKQVAASAIEHISVLNPMKYLQKIGFRFSLIPVDSQGLVDLEKLDQVVTKDTLITSIMYANNEIGTIEPIKEISSIVHKKGHYFHVDAVAAGGYLPLDVQKDNIDLLTLSSSSLYGPPGAGVLYVKPGVKLQPILPGGGQERGFRSGSENIFAIAGIGEAARIAKKERVKETSRLQNIRDSLIKGILKIDDTYLTGHPTLRLPHHASFRFNYIEGESILLSLDTYNIQVATGSACSSRTLEPSHVLLGIGLKHEEAHGSMVLTLGRSNTPRQVPHVITGVKNTVEKLRNLSPLYTKKK
jgi:cysteine desulfurase